MEEGQNSFGGLNPNFGAQNTSGGGLKRHKKLIFGIIGAVILVAVAVIVFLVINMKRSNAATDNLIKFIEDGVGYEQGEALDEEETDEELVYAVAIANSSESNIKRYYEQLSELEEAFLSSVDQDSDVILKYKKGLDIMRSAVDYVTVRKEMLSKYIEGGREAAETYINETIVCDTDSWILRAVCRKELDYYESVLNEYVVYRDAGCEIDEAYNVDCTNNEQSLIELLNRPGTDDSSAYYLMRMTNSNIKNGLSSEIRRLSSELKEANG